MRIKMGWIEAHGNCTVDLRIDFFLENTEKTLQSQTVFDRDGMTEQIVHEPLGVIANISAWNYPYFVGSNVFIPALLAGNTVLYKPSEFAAQTGLSIARLLHESGVPENRARLEGMQFIVIFSPKKS